MIDLARIRLLGDQHTAFRDSEGLVVIDNEALAAHAPRAVTRRHAEELVASRRAEWIGEPPEAA